MAARAAALRGRAGGFGSRAGWTIGDQALSSISNAGLSLLVARAVDARSFGAFTVAFVVFTIVIGVTRAWICEPLVIRYSGEKAAADRGPAAAQSAGASLAVGAVAALACAAVGALVGGGVGRALLALAVVLPALLLQDTWRYAMFAARRPKDATLNDLLWAVVQFGVSAVLILADRDGVVTIVLAWGLGAAAAAALGCVQVGQRPRLRGSVGWLRQQREYGARLGLGFLLNTGAVNAAVFVVGAVAGLAAAGSLRAAQTLVGPLQALFAAVSALVLPVLAGRVADGRRIELRPAAGVSGVLGAISVTGVGLLLLLPDSIGRELLGDSWAGAREVLPAIGAVIVLVALAAGPSIALRAWAEGRLLLRNTLAQAPCILVLSGGGAVLAGAQGAATGLAVAHVVGLSLMWFDARSTARRRQGEVPLSA